MSYVLLFPCFSLPLAFNFVAARISHFLTAATKFSCFSSNEIGHFTIVSLVSQPLTEREAEGDLVLIQTSFLF